MGSFEVSVPLKGSSWGLGVRLQGVYGFWRVECLGVDAGV